MEKVKLFAGIWIIALVISIGGGFIGAKIYNVYFNHPPKFYQFDLVKAIKNENAVLLGSHTTPVVANQMFTFYLKKINKRLKKYSKNGIVFIKGAIVEGNVPNITDKVVAK